MYIQVSFFDKCKIAKETGIFISLFLFSRLFLQWGSVADISFIDQPVAVHLKSKLLHPFYFQSSRSRRRGQERWMVRSWCKIPEMDGSERVEQTFSAVKWNLIMIRFGFNFLIF